MGYTESYLDLLGFTWFTWAMVGYSRLYMGSSGL